MLCKRVENEEWGTIDYIDDKLPEENSNRIVFRTRKEVRRRPDPPASFEALHERNASLC